MNIEKNGTWKTDLFSKEKKIKNEKWIIVIIWRTIFAEIFRLKITFPNRRMNFHLKENKETKITFWFLGKLLDDKKVK